MTDFKISNDLILLGASTFGAAKDAQMHRGDAADIIEQRRGANPQEWRLYDRFVSHSDYDRLTIYIGGGPPLKTIEFEAESSNASQGISIDIEALPGGSSDGRLNLKCGSTNLLQLAPTATSLNTPLAITTSGTNSLSMNGFITLGAGVGTSGIGIKMDIAGQGASDFEDSHKFDMIGAGENANRATWRTFVDVINVGGDSIWTLQDDKNGGGFVTNFSITDDGGFNFPLPLPSHAIGGAIDTQYQLLLDGDYFSLLGADLVAAKLKIENRLTAPTGATTALFGVSIDTNIRTQTATQSIANIAQLNLEEPAITDQLTGGGLITNAQTLLISGAPTEGVSNHAIRVIAGDVLFGGNLAVSGAGPHAIAGTPSGIIGLIISETFTSDGSGTLASGVFVTQTLVGASGDTTSLTGTTFISAITTQTETESIANVSQVEINEPFITDNLTGDITNAQSLLIVNAPTEGLSNFALRVASGLTLVQALEIDGELDHDGSTVGFFGTTPATQPAAYTRNAVIVEDRTLLASASATALNNNNVLAALIADLQSLGIIG